MNYLQEFPINLLQDLPNHTGIEGGAVLVIAMEYGRNFSGPGKDTFRSDRAIGEPSEAHLSNFLHPVLYFYKSIPSGQFEDLSFSLSCFPYYYVDHHFSPFMMPYCILMVMLIF